MAALITSVCWVGKGCAQEVPDKIQLSSEEAKELYMETKRKLQQLGEDEPDSDPTLRKTGPGGDEESDETKGRKDGHEPSVEELYDLDNYDEEEEGLDSGTMQGLSLAGLTLHCSNEEDPYITLEDIESSDDDEDNDRIYPTDNLVCVAKIGPEDDAIIEIHTYSEADSHNFCHHHIQLGAFPLALEWLDYDPDYPDKKGNLLAVGKMDSVVEVYDLDIMGALEPVLCLGQPVREEEGLKKKKKKKKKSKESEGEDETAPGGHLDAVLCISWNKNMRNVLATGSADGNVIVWDLASCSILLTLTHSDKVECLQWHPYQPQLLLTGSSDGSVQLFDCLAAPKSPRTWKTTAEVEKVLWNHLDPEVFLAGCGDGMVYGMSVAREGFLFQLKAHDGSVTDLSLSCQMPGLLCTVSEDRSLKVWDILEGKVKFLYSKDMKMGSLFTGKMSVDGPFCLALGGENDGFRVLKLDKLEEVRLHFKSRPMMTAAGPSSDQAQAQTPSPRSTTTKPSPAATKQPKARKKENGAVAMETEQESQSDSSLLSSDQVGGARKQVGVAPSRRRKHKKNK